MWSFRSIRRRTISNRCESARLKPTSTPKPLAASQKEGEEERRRGLATETGTSQYEMAPLGECLSVCVWVQQLGRCPKLIGVNDGVICTIARSKNRAPIGPAAAAGRSLSPVLAYNNKLSASCCNWEILRHYQAERDREREGEEGELVDFKVCRLWRQLQAAPFGAAIPPLITNSPKWNVCSATNWQLCWRCRCCCYCCCWSCCVIVHSSIPPFSPLRAPRQQNERWFYFIDNSLKLWRSGVD